MHFRWMVDHFRDNGVNPEDHDVIWAAVGAQPGFVPFWIGDPDGWYGQAIASKARDPLPSPRIRRRLKARSVLGRPPIMSATEKSLVWVPCVTLAELLAPDPKVDLIDLDARLEFEVLEPQRVVERARSTIHIGHTRRRSRRPCGIWSAARVEELKIPVAVTRPYAIRDITSVTECRSG